MARRINGEPKQFFAPTAAGMGSRGLRVGSSPGPLTHAARAAPIFALVCTTNFFASLRSAPVGAQAGHDARGAVMPRRSTIVGRKAAPPRKPPTIERLEQAVVEFAALVVRDGPEYAPFLERAQRELEAARNSPEQQARRILAEYAAGRMASKPVSAGGCLLTNFQRENEHGGA